MKKTILTLSALLAAASLFAKIEMPRIFSDNMVLQRGEEVKIWGKAAPNAKVKVSFLSKSAETKADKDGKWSLRLSALKAQKDPAQMEFFENGKLDATIGNILVGEVWVSGGQSNMQWTVEKSTGFEEVKQRADYPQMRFFVQPNADVAPKAMEDSNPVAKWEVITPENVGSKNAVAFFFVEELMKKFDVPVGVVETPLGGSRMVAWLAEEDLKGQDCYAEDLKYFADTNAGYTYESAMEKWNERKGAYEKRKIEAKESNKVFKESAPKQPNKYTLWVEPQRTPSMLYNAKIAPIAGYTAKGFIWYQGESDARDTVEGRYSAKFERLVNCWRKYWGKKDMPFIFAQLTSYYSDSNWPLARWEQYTTSKKMKNLEMAVIIDIGEERDIHPKNKIEVGRRFANIAFDEVYDIDGIHAFGPELDEVDYKGNTAELEFDAESSGLVINGELRGFEALVSGEWVPAKALLKGKKSIILGVENADAKIEGVRYLWKNWAQPDVCIFDKYGLPAGPFRNLKK